MRGRTNIGGGGISINGILSQATVDEGQIISAGDFIEYKIIPTLSEIAGAYDYFYIQECVDLGIYKILSVRTSSTNAYRDMLVIMKQNGGSFEFVKTKQVDHLSIAKMSDDMIVLCNYQSGPNTIEVLQIVDDDFVSKITLGIESLTEVTGFVVEGNTIYLCRIGYETKIYVITFSGTSLVYQRSLTCTGAKSSTSDQFTLVGVKNGNIYYTDCNYNASSSVKRTLNLSKIYINGSSISYSLLTEISNSSNGAYFEGTVAFGSGVYGDDVILFPSSYRSSTSSTIRRNEIRVWDIIKGELKRIVTSDLGIDARYTYPKHLVAANFDTNKFAIMTLADSSGTSLETHPLLTIIEFDSVSKTFSKLSNTLDYVNLKLYLTQEGDTKIDQFNKWNHLLFIKNGKIDFVFYCNKTYTESSSSKAVTKKYVYDNRFVFDGATVSDATEESLIRQWTGATIAAGIAADDGVEGDVINYYKPDTNK